MKTTLEMLILIVVLVPATNASSQTTADGLDAGTSVETAGTADAGAASIPTIASTPAAPDTSFGWANGPWGPGRRVIGESFQSAAETLPDGLLRFNWRNGSLGFGAQYHARSEFRTNADFDTVNPDATLGVEQRARITVRGSMMNRVGLWIDVQDVRSWGTERSPNIGEPWAGVHQGFVDLRMHQNFEVRIGRQELAYGEERLIGAADWGLAARAFDGVWMRGRIGDKITVDGFGMMLRPPSFIEANGAAPRFHNSGSYFYGLYSRLRPASWLGGDVYVLGLSQDDSTFATGPRPETKLATLGLRLVGKASAFTGIGEGVFQLGSAGGVDVRSGAFAMRANYTLPVSIQPYMQLEVLGATPEFNALFPTAHQHLGFIDYVAWRNTWSVKATLGVKPFGTHFWVDIHHFRMWDTQKPWYNAAGAVFRPAALRTSDAMGTEVDFSGTYPFTRWTALAFAYAIFVPDAAAQNATGTLALTPSHWAFLYLRTQI